MPFTSVAAGGPQAELRARLQFRLAALRASRHRLLAHQAENGMPDETLTTLLAETDHEELRALQQIAQAR